MMNEFSRAMDKQNACPHSVVVVGGIKEDFQYLECLACGLGDYNSLIRKRAGVE
jgi:hypothetical protein